MSVTPTYAVRPGEVLSVIADKVEVMERMMCRSVDNFFERMVGDHIRVVNEDGPKVDQDEQDEVEMSLEGEDEGEEVVRDGLGITIHWVEGMRCEGRGDDPLVVRFMDILIEEGKVEPTMDPVNTIISEEQV